MTAEPVVALCGTCHAIAPASKWLTSDVAYVNSDPDRPYRVPPLICCPACGIGYDVSDPDAGRYEGSWPAMIRLRLELRAGAS